MEQPRISDCQIIAMFNQQAAQLRRIQPFQAGEQGVCGLAHGRQIRSRVGKYVR